MQLSIRIKFLLSFIAIATVGISLFSLVVYDSSLEFKHSQEKRLYSVISRQFIEHVSEYKHNFSEVKKELIKYSKIKTKTGEMYAVLNDDLNIAFLSVDNHKINHILDLIGKDIKNNLKEGKLARFDDIFFWQVKPFPKNIKSNQMLVFIYPLSNSVSEEFFDIFGIPLIVTSILILWTMLWAAIILSSLVNKLQNQKQTLSNQAIEIEHARDGALQANSAKSNFLANMSHEIRTPLTSIIGFAETFLDIDQSMEERSKATKTIIKSGHHLMNIINEILDLSKVEAGKFDVESDAVSLVELLNEVKSFVMVLAEEKGLSFGINYTYPIPKTIFTDALRLKQVLLNLCSNSIKFTSTGHVYLNVAYISQSSSMIFEVDDTGIGMTAEQQEKIFKPFEQADSSTTRRYGGTGLGLTLSKQIVELLNGELSVESTVNKGSRFTVKINIDAVSNLDYIYSVSDNVVEKTIKETSKIPKLSGKVLLVEDSEDIQDLVKLLLGKTGVELDVVNNGQLAIKKASEINYDLIYMDIQMPVMDGFTAISKLREQGYTLPVVAMTANVMQKDRDACSKAGFDGFIAKPINREELYQILTRYIKSMETFESKKVLLTSDLLHDEPDLINLIDKFMTRLPIMKDAIIKANTEGEIEELSGLVHQMKGVGGGYGYPMLTELCAKLNFK